jgi:2-oxoglutarate dehydrogenase E2 component (dihydrolipoamide succinyltransferase)
MSHSKPKHGTDGGKRLAGTLTIALLLAAACASPEPVAPAPAAKPAPAAAAEPAPAPAQPAPAAAAPPVPSDIPEKIDGANLTMGSAAADGLEATDLRCKTSGQMFAGMAIIGSLAKQKGALDACAPKGEAVRVHFVADGAKVSDVRVAGASDPAVARCVADAVGGAAFPSPCTCALSMKIGPTPAQ